jgi:hypothetical protein
VYGEGPGFRLGSAPLVIHPGLAVEGGYDSNVFYLPSNETASALLRLRAHVDLATLPPQAFENDHSTADPKVDFRLSAQAEYREYLTSNETVRQQRSINLLGSADLAFLPRGPFTLRLSDVFMRTVDPRTEVLAGSYTRDFNRLGFLASYRWGGLEVGVGDYFQLNIWETPDLKFGNDLSDEGQAFARLRVLPQTQVSASVRAGWVHYNNNAVIDSVPVRALIGATTLFTSWLGASVNVGYGNSLNQKNASYNNVIGSADLRFMLPLAARITLGYDRDFYDSLFANYYSDDHVMLAYDMPFIGRFAGHIDGGVRFRHYASLVAPTVLGAMSYNSPTRDDLVYEVHAEVTMRALDWLAFAVSYGLVADHTDFALIGSPLQQQPDPNAQPTPLGYLKHTAFLRADVAY